MPETTQRPELADLMEQLLDALGARRARGDGSYPPTLRELSRDCGDPPDDRLLRAAAAKAFTARASVPVKVARKPSPGSPVYFKEDVPPKPKPEPKPKREPKPRPNRESAAERDERQAAELAGRMVAVLDSQRRLGGAAYPATLRRLAELCEMTTGPDARIRKAADHETMAGAAVVAARAGKSADLDAPVLFRDDLEGRSEAHLPALLGFALTPPPATGKGKPKDPTHAFTADELARRFIPAIQGPFRAALARGIDQQSLPPEVAWVTIKGKDHLFLLANLRPEPSRRPSAPAPATDPGPDPSRPPARDGVPAPATRPDREFAAAFREAFGDLDRRHGARNFVKLSDLRSALAGFSREEFDAGLRQLRIDDQFSLNSHEGFHDTLSREDREAGIREAGSLLIYVTRR